MIVIDQDKQAGISKVLIERFEKDRLPRLLKIKERVDQGRTLDQTDLAFLERVITDAKENQYLVDSIPHCRDLFARIVHLYRDITKKALDNEGPMDP